MVIDKVTVIKRLAIYSEQVNLKQNQGRTWNKIQVSFGYLERLQALQGVTYQYVKGLDYI